MRYSCYANMFFSETILRLSTTILICFEKQDDLLNQYLFIYLFGPLFLLIAPRSQIKTLFCFVFA